MKSDIVSLGYIRIEWRKYYEHYSYPGLEVCYRPWRNNCSNHSCCKADSCRRPGCIKPNG